VRSLHVLRAAYSSSTSSSRQLPTDVVLLPIIFIGLRRPRRAGGGKVGLTRLLWKRLALESLMPMILVRVLDGFDVMFQLPTWITNGSHRNMGASRSGRFGLRSSSSPTLHLRPSGLKMAISESRRSNRPTPHRFRALGWKWRRT